MSKYHKIESMFKRDNDGKIIEYAWTKQEFEYLSNNEWLFTEKVDGTNIRVIFDGIQITFGGRTDSAQLPAPLVERLQETFLPQIDTLIKKFPDGVVLYGEGYGANIQKGGGNYRPDQDFVLFDVKVGPWWLERNNVGIIARDLGIEVVPVISSGTLMDAVEMCKEGFDSQWGNFQAEGIVARPETELATRSGERIITKIKIKDFQ